MMFMQKPASTSASGPRSRRSRWLGAANLRCALLCAVVLVLSAQASRAERANVDEAAIGDIRDVRLGPGRPRLITAVRESQRAQIVVQFQTGAFDDGLVWGLSRVCLLYTSPSPRD